MLLGLLNFILDDADAERVVSALISAVPAGSYLVITHPTLEVGGQANADAMRFWNENATPPITACSSARSHGSSRACGAAGPRHRALLTLAAHGSGAGQRDHCAAAGRGRPQELTGCNFGQGGAQGCSRPLPDQPLFRWYRAGLVAGSRQASSTTSMSRQLRLNLTGRG